MAKIVPLDSAGDSLTALFQWDKGIEITIEDDLVTEAHNVHFANTQSGQAYVVEGAYDSTSGALTAQIPDILLQSTKPVLGYVYDEDDSSGRSTLWFKIKVIARAQPSDYVYEDSVEYILIEDAVEEITALVAAAAASSAAAETSATAAEESATAAAESAAAAAESATAAEESATAAAESAESALEDALAALGFGVDEDGYIYQEVEEDE